MPSMEGRYAILLALPLYYVKNSTAVKPDIGVYYQAVLHSALVR